MTEYFIVELFPVDDYRGNRESGSSLYQPWHILNKNFWRIPNYESRGKLLRSFVERRSADEKIAGLKTRRSAGITIFTTHKNMFFYVAVNIIFGFIPPGGRFLRDRRTISLPRMIY